MNGEQLQLSLTPAAANSLDYFVVHSGVTSAVNAIEYALSRVIESPHNFEIVVIAGPKGVGKTHLVNAYVTEGERRGLPAGRVTVADLKSTPAEREISADALGDFVSKYELRRAEGGLLLVEIEVVPSVAHGLDAHLRSRLVAGQVVEVAFPSEQELMPVLASILERRNIRLPNATMEYLIERLGRSPAEFSEIVALLDTVSLKENRRAGVKLLSELLRGSKTVRNEQLDERVESERA